MARAGQDAREGAKAAPAQSQFARIQETALVLEGELARYGQTADAEEFLAAARVVEALRLILATPLVVPSHPAIQRGTKGPDIDPRTLAGGIGKAASDLRSLAQKWGAPVDGKGRYPDSSARVDKAACALREGLARALAADPNADLALIVEGLRLAYTGEGSLTVLPHSGTQEERIALFRRAIANVSPSEAGEFDARDVIAACARRCGNTRELFGAERKRDLRR